MSERRPLSIRARLYAGLLGAIIPLSVGAGVAVYAHVRTSVTRQFDERLEAKARTLATMVKVGPGAPVEHRVQGVQGVQGGGGADRGRLRLAFDAAILPEFSRRHDPEYFQVWEIGGDGVVGATLGKSASLKAGELPVRLPAKRMESEVCRLGRNGPGRVPCSRVKVGGEVGGVGGAGAATGAREREGVALEGGQRAVLVAVAGETEPIDKSLHEVIRALAVAGAGLGVAVVLTIFLAVRGVLSPLAALAGAVERVDPADAERRYQEPKLPAELLAISGGIADLDGRVREAIGRERRFTSAAAHEFRTPLAEARALLDVRLKWPEDVASCVGTMGDVRAIHIRLERMTAVLLSLARAEATQLPWDRQRIELLALVGERVGKVAARGMRIDAALGEGADPVWVVGSRAGLEMLLDNLLDNATSHGAAETTVVIRVAKGASGAQLTVSNVAPQLQVSDLEHLFEPFWRHDTVRTAASISGESTSRMHLGLGLSIAAAVAKHEGIGLTVQLREDVVTFTLMFPTDSKERPCAGSTAAPLPVRTLSPERKSPRSVRDVGGDGIGRTV